MGAASGGAFLSIANFPNNEGVLSFPRKVFLYIHVHLPPSLRHPNREKYRHLSTWKACFPRNWAGRYNVTPMFIETFVEILRHTGAVNQASGLIDVGINQEHGHYDQFKQFDKPKKDISLRPLRKGRKRRLNQ